jgi:glycosyltransferase involved in cell wall biosynthesis
MQVHQMLASLTFGDAVGNQALYIQSLLRARGIESEIFAESSDALMRGRCRPLLAYEDVSSPENVVILHFSIGSRTSSLARVLPDKLMLVYHNVTPAHWFVPYAPKVARQCIEGRAELGSLKCRTALSLGVSEYNRRELEEAGFSPTGVMPLLFDRRRLEAPPNPVILEMYDDDRTNFLVVGRIMPNKRLEDVMKVFKVYQKYIEGKSRLILVGQYLDFERYFEHLLRYLDELGLKHVVFAGHVDTNDLVAFYQLADVYLSMSEHEGFCAPLLEAFQMDVPVIAYAAGAIEETLGGAGVLAREKRFLEIAELAHLLAHDEEVRGRVVEGQRRVIEERRSRNDGEILMGFVDQAARI